MRRATVEVPITANRRDGIDPRCSIRRSRRGERRGEDSDETEEDKRTPNSSAAYCCTEADNRPSDGERRTARASP